MKVGTVKKERSALHSVIYTAIQTFTVTATTALPAKIVQLDTWINLQSTVHQRQTENALNALLGSTRA
jgi:hypothetical protein